MNYLEFRGENRLINETFRMMHNTITIDSDDSTDISESPFMFSYPVISRIEDVITPNNTNMNNTNMNNTNISDNLESSNDNTDIVNTNNINPGSDNPANTNHPNIPIIPGQTVDLSITQSEPVSPNSNQDNSNQHIS